MLLNKTVKNSSSLGSHKLWLPAPTVFLNSFPPAIIVSGGKNADAPSEFGKPGLFSVEVLHSDGSPWCSLPRLTEDRIHHSQTGLEACGGSSESSATSSSSTTCVTLSAGSKGGIQYLEKAPTSSSTLTLSIFDFSPDQTRAGGSWTPSHQLTKERGSWGSLHSSWASPAGTVLISGHTSELLSNSSGGSAQHFYLKYKTRYVLTLTP